MSNKNSKARKKLEKYMVKVALWNVQELDK